MTASAVMPPGSGCTVRMSSERVLTTASRSALPFPSLPYHPAVLPEALVYL